MSIISELTRIQSAKANIVSAIVEKGGIVPTGALLDAFAGAIRALPSGGGDTDAEDGIITKKISGSYTNARVSIIESGVFSNCKSLTTAYFPICTTIGSNAFNGCDALTTVSFPACTTIPMSAFYSCKSLTTASFPACTSIGAYAFLNCSSLTIASFPVCTTIGMSAFHSCKSLTTASFPACTSIGVSAFYSCASLTTAYFPVCTTIGSNAFQRCYFLTSLFLLGASICSLPHSNAFSSTPIAGYTAFTSGVYGSIFVPASLVNTYKSATNWTYFASRIAAIPES